MAELNPKEKLAEYLKKTDAQIEAIKKSQLNTIHSYIKNIYGFEKDDVIGIKGMKCIITGFDVDHNLNIKIRYSKINYNNSIDKLQFKSTINQPFERFGKYVKGNGNQQK